MRIAPESSSMSTMSPAKQKKSTGRAVNKDTVLQFTGDTVLTLVTLKTAVQGLETKEMHQLSARHKLVIIQVLCDACYETASMRRYLENNAEERANKISELNRIMKDEKAKAREVSVSKREAAIEACRAANRNAAAAAARTEAAQSSNDENGGGKGKSKAVAKSGKGKSNAKTSGKNSSTGKNSATAVLKESFEPTPGQVQAMLDDMVILESVGVDEVIESVPIPEIEDDDDGDENALNEDDTFQYENSRRITAQLRAKAIDRNKQRLERENRIVAVQAANDKLIYAIDTSSEKELTKAIKIAQRTGLRWRESGKEYCTELMKKVTVL